ncbi:AraC-like DNA-binding protein [Lutibacter sp. Hel_I_33_5]|uniref:helix-turn-helix domain-containing protein n=1 Tax=Lutibacter sp. Hel_I_33_5 TaxID=1566289 RepID=UPI0011A6C92E|nr:AraC family transcriptional regulator [Lutibacter sp. Hel_I_33_5]TVZ57230.1 AraC-like DNA-binding protein [Lutibacter sp. Hel_I_33_5]
MLDRIANWYHLSKQYFFTYKEGFFNLSFLSNSPEVIMKSFIKMPFVKHNAEEQKINVVNPFVFGESYYAELEEGLWLLHSTITYKNNVSFTPIYDKFLPSDYYCLTFGFIENNFKLNHFESNNVKIINETISFIKPKSDYLHCHFKGSSSKMFLIYFNKDWLAKNILNAPNVKQSTIKLFEKETNNIINYTIKSEIFNKITLPFINSYKENSKTNVLELKKCIYNFLDYFFQNLNDIENFEPKRISVKSTLKINKIENYLMSTIYNKFPGIDFLSEKFNVSPTKLKNDFKSIYNTSIFKYYQAKQMDLSLKYLLRGEYVKDIAAKFNYQNVSKFSNAFKNHHAVLPSHFK